MIKQAGNKKMEVPEPLVERNIQSTVWTDDPNIDCIQRALANTGYDYSSLEKQTMTRYTLHQPLGSTCSCRKHTITVTRDILLQSCRCNVQVLALSPHDIVYETSPKHYHVRYSREKARPIRVPSGFKFVALKSDTGTGKNFQIDVLLRALLYGQYSRYHSAVERSELGTLRNALGPIPGVVFIGPRCLYDIEMVRKLSVHGAQLYKDTDKYDESPVWVWQFQSPEIQQRGAQDIGDRRSGVESKSF